MVYELTNLLSSLYTQRMKKLFSFENVFRNVKSHVANSLPSRVWDWQAVALVIVLVQISSTRLTISEWVPDLDITQKISLYAVILGLVLGYSSFNRKHTIWAVIEYGILIIPMQLLIATERTDVYYDDMRNLFLRIFDAISLFIKNQPVYDTLFFVMLTSIGFWLLGAYAGYRLTRHQNFLDVVLGPGLVVLLVQLYDPWVPLRAWGLAIYIFVALALLGRINYLENKTKWKKRNVFTSSDTEWEFSRSVLSSAALAVFIAWALPGALSNVKPVSEAWKDFTKPIMERLSDAVSALDSPYNVTTTGDFYGTKLKLGTSAPISDTPVFYVTPENSDTKILRYYWRGRVYDQYEDGQWTNTSSMGQIFNPQDQEMNLVDELTRVEMNFMITMNFPKQDLLYAPSEIIWVNKEGRIEFQPLDDNIREVQAWFADPSLVAGDRYEVRALIANPTIQELRFAGTDYPAWVTERYLQVPPKMEAQLKELAEEITAQYPTSFEKAQAITSFLRREIEYQSTITEMPPQGEDPLLWVLFDHKKGFCMYYASAEVLMLRTIGIPARMAVGFAEGEFDEQRDRYTVARLNSHAWPEVYFPGIGWVEFEPTGNQDPLNRPLGEVSNTTNNDGLIQPSSPILENGELENLPGFDPTLNDDENLPATQDANPLRNFLLPALTILLFSAAIFLIWRYSITDRLPVYLAERYTKSGARPPHWLSRWAQWAKLLPIERAFHAINSNLRRLGYTQPGYKTPAERANTLITILPSAEDAIKELALQYQTALFTSRTANLSSARRASLKITFEALRIRILKYKDYRKRRYN